ncbi:hypothetical protein WJX81_000871 [Elliptochloris bilobata]|uniref:EF-hand domain-containing protein n=1 Tax=Elliptochloris bilobata TaxID=381761 RepID=A0AAW1RZL5_9CHLO
MLVRAVETEEKKPDTKDKDKADRLVRGLDKATAQNILKVWEQTGAGSSPDALRKMLINRSLRTLGTVLLQVALDTGASWGAFSTAGYIASGADFFGKIAVEYLAYALGLYFAIGVVLDAFLLGATGYAAIQYSTNAEAFLQAVRQVAGARQQSGLDVVDKAQSAVNLVKVIGALNQISDMLRAEAGNASGGRQSSLKSLSAFLTLSKAQERGFDADKFGLSSDEAAQIATVFSRFDENDDMVLEPLEVKRLFREEGFSFSEEEETKAVQLLDTSGDGLIQFEEFVDFWVNKVDPSKAQAKP